MDKETLNDRKTIGWRSWVTDDGKIRSGFIEIPEKNEGKFNVNNKH